MAVAKKYRLNGKEIQFLLRRGQKIYGKLFIFRIYEQYKNLGYSQWSVQIPVKLDKRATTRNMLKRRAHVLFQESLDRYRLTGGKIQCKVFVFVNKQALETMKEVIATDEKRAIVETRDALCRKDFTLFFDRIGTHISRGVKTGGVRQKHGKSHGKRRRAPEKKKL